VQGDRGEKDMAWRTQTKRQPGSGSGLRKKEDLVSERELIQVKTAKGKRFSITLAELDTLYDRAFEGWAFSPAKIPVLVVKFLKPAECGEWAMVPLAEWIKRRST
jgi:hypothetical protein